MCQQIVDFDSQIVFWISICCIQKPVEMDGEMELLLDQVPDCLGLKTEHLQNGSKFIG